MYVIVASQRLRCVSRRLLPGLVGSCLALYLITRIMEVLALAQLFACSTSRLVDVGQTWVAALWIVLCGLLVTLQFYILVDVVKMYPRMLAESAKRAPPPMMSSPSALAQ